MASQPAWAQQGPALCQRMLVCWQHGRSVACQMAITAVAMSCHMGSDGRAFLLRAEPSLAPLPRISGCPCLTARRCMLYPSLPPAAAWAAPAAACGRAPRALRLAAGALRHPPQPCWHPAGQAAAAKLTGLPGGCPHVCTGVRPTVPTGLLTHTAMMRFSLACAGLNTSSTIRGSRWSFRRIAPRC